MKEKRLIKSEENRIYSIIDQLNGVDKKIAMEILNKTTLLLGITNSPIDTKKIKEVWFPDILAKKKIENMKYLYAEDHHHICVGWNETIQIFIRTSIWYSGMLPNYCLYYKLSDKSDRIRKLTKKNLLQDFERTVFENVLKEYLSKNNVAKKEKGTGRFLIIAVLDTTKRK